MESMTMTWLVLACGSIAVLSGLTGWGAGALAVTMMFRPTRAVRFFGLEIAGVIPKRRAELARRIGETIERELISHRDIQNLIDTPAFHEEAARLLNGNIDDFINNSLGSNPLIGMFLSATVTAGIRDVLVREIQHMIPTAMELMFKRVEVDLDFKGIIRRRIDEFDLSRLEGIMREAASKELRAITWYGGALGLAAGLVQGAVVFMLARHW
jgi:uncharacterized membrane protein YheB (UPF0754 family)